MLGKFGNAVVAGYRAAITSWRHSAVSYTQEYAGQWNDYDMRLRRYIDASHYYNATVYTDLQKYWKTKREEQHLYEYMAGFYNPTRRLVQGYEAAIYKGALDLNYPQSGAIPLATENERILDSVAMVWKWSNWQQKRQLYVHYGALYGDSFIKVVDDQQRREVRLETLHPSIVEDVRYDGEDIVYVKITYQMEADGSTFEYSEIITPESFATFRDGQPFAFYEDANGEAVAEWENEYGFVPVVHVKHADKGQRFGENALGASWVNVDQLNKTMSLLVRSVEKAVVPVYFGRGMQSNNDLKASSVPGGITVVTGSTDSSMEPLVPNVPIADTLQVCQELHEEIERNLPELALHRIRQSGNLTAPGVRTAYSDALALYKAARIAYDAGLVKAHKFALRIGGYRGYFAGFGLDSIADTEHYINDRPIVEDQLTRREQIDILVSTVSNDNVVPSALRVALVQAGFDQVVVDRIVAESTNRRDRTTNDVLATLTAFANGIDIEEDTEQ